MFSDTPHAKARRLAEHMLLVCGPSGVGKSTLVHGVLDTRPQSRLSVSYTTRLRRGSEEDGVDYHFVDRHRFEEMIAAGSFAEWAEVHGNLYGTTHAAILEAQRANEDILFDIDYQGARQLKEKYQGAWAILVCPPSMVELESRLRGRGTESNAVVERRLAAARTELAQVDLFDFVVVNEELAAAQKSVLSIYDAMRQRRERGALLAGLKTSPRE